MKTAHFGWKVQSYWQVNWWKRCSNHVNSRPHSHCGKIAGVCLFNLRNVITSRQDASLSWGLTEPILLNANKNTDREIIHNNTEQYEMNSSKCLYLVLGMFGRWSRKEKKQKSVQTFTQSSLQSHRDQAVWWELETKKMLLFNSSIKCSYYHTLIF